jgi:Zn finger protein HypA/HybF involved in hydrogenase expression
MHELSIVQALMDLVNQHTPPGVAVEAVTVEAGPMRSIDDGAMQLAWQSTVVDTALAKARLEVRLLPWRLQCPACGLQWDSEELFVACACGNASPRPVGGNDLRLVSLDVSDPPGPQAHSGVG